jgi:transposase-like protein
VKGRKQFIAALRAGEYSFAEVCRRFGISRKSGYTWLDRFREEGSDDGLEPSLEDRPRRPRHSPTSIRDDVDRAIVDTRKRHPTWARRSSACGLRSTSPARTAIVRDRHQARRIRETPAATQPHCSLRLAVGARDPSQRGLVHRLRGRLPDRSHALLPADDAGCVQLLVIACVALTSTELLPISPLLP